MQLNVHSRAKAAPISDSTRQYLEKKLGRLGKHFRQEPEAQVSQGFERGQHIIEVTLNGDGIVLRGQERNTDMNAAIDGVVDKMESQLVRFKQKRTDMRRHSSAVRAEAPADTEPIEALPRIARRKNFPMKSMSPEEASLEMELLGHSFFVFLNDETQNVGVIYRRSNGDYGLIEPKV